MDGSSRRLCRCCMATSAVALATLAGWLFNIPELSRVVSFGILTSPATAVLFLCLAAALCPRLPWSRRARLALIAPLFVVPAPMMILFTAKFYEGGWLAVYTHPILDVWAHPWILSPMTGPLFFLIGASAASFLRHGRVDQTAAAWGTAVVGCVSGSLLVGYLCRLPTFAGSHMIAMALPTAVCFLAFSVALLAELGRGVPPWSLFEGPSPRALMMRAFIPLVAACIIFMGYVDSWNEFAGSALAAGTIIIAALLGAAWLVARVSLELGAEIESTGRRLQESQARTSAILRTAMDGFCMTDLEGRIVDVNDAYCGMSGYSLEELLGMRISQLSHAESSGELAARFNRLRSGLQERFVTRHWRKDGSVFPLEVAAQFSPDGGGRVFAFLRDITEREASLRRIEESDRRYRAIFSGAPDGVLVADVDMRIFLYANPAMCSLFGRTEAELVALHPLELHPPEARAQAAIEFEQHTTGARALGLTIPCQRKDGSVFYADITSSRVEIDGRPCVVGFFTDVTIRKASQDALREREAFIRTILESLPVGIAVNSAAPPVKFEYMNANFPRLYRTTREKLVSPDSFWEAAYEDAQFRETMRRRVLDDCASGDMSRMVWTDVPIARAGAETSYVTAMNIPLPEQNLMISVVTDVTDRVRVERALQESETRFRALIERAPEAVFVESGGRFVYLNPAAVGLFGARAAEDLIAKVLSERIAPEFREIVVGRRSSLIETGKPTPLRELEFLRVDGSRIAVETTAFRVRYQGEDANVVFVRDVRVRRELESERVRMQKLDSLGVLAGGIAHDFNNMLTGILGNLELLKAGPPPGVSSSDLTKEAVDACARAKALAKQLLTFASGGAPVLDVVDLAALVREAAPFAARGSNVRLEVSDEGDCRAKVDPDQIAQVVQNLVLNAVQAMPTGGTLHLDLARLAPETGESGESVRLRVRDTGTGISPQHLSRIFDPFFSTKGNSRGLGLSMVHSIVTKHGGRIEVDSKLGEGTEFRLSLPGATAAAAAAKAPAPVVTKGVGRVLIMDDEPSVAAVLSRMLKSLGYSSETVPDGESAVRAYRRARESGAAFDAAVLDLTIAGGAGGKETVGRLLEADPAARVIVSSGYSTDPVMADYRAHGFCGIFSKPYRLSDVSQAMSDAIPPKPASAA